MFSPNLHELEITKTRLQKETHKRRAEEQLRQNVELKRQKQIFALEKTIGPRDIFADSMHPKIKQENVSGRLSAVKQEILTIEPTAIEKHDNFINSVLPNIKLEVGNSLVVKVEETLELDEYSSTKRFSEDFERVEQSENLVNKADLEVNVNMSEIKQNDISSVSLSESEDDEFLQDHLKLLKLLVQQKDQEITLLAELTEGLQNQSNVLGNKFLNSKTENHKLNTDDFSTNNADAIFRPRSDIYDFRQLNLALIKNDTIIRQLSTKLLKLQSKIFGKQDFTSNIYTNKMNCIRCGQLCKSESALRRHIIYQHTKRTLTCPHCECQYHTEAQLSKHAKMHSNPEQWDWQCKVCQKKFIRQRKLNRHMKTHKRTQRGRLEINSNEDSWEISTQEQTTQQSTATIVIEKERCAGDNKFNHVKCDKCGEQFKSETALHEHRTHPEFDPICQVSCRYCEKKFPEKPFLIEHMENCHDAEILNRFDNEWESDWELDEDMKTHTTDTPSNDVIVP